MNWSMVVGVVLLAVQSLQLQGQIDSSSCVTTQAVFEVYRGDAERLALRRILRNRLLLIGALPCV